MQVCLGIVVSFGQKKRQEVDLQQPNAADESTELN